ncbi:hypothetical protein [Rhodococcus erythropolis]|uniref:hypothetical protein n=1 Tax=Rhodococcus erythropolis TaxID=1833 RepID=UPI001F1668BA|nr:hypothetical protein [Rhodococcus erythropolis]
MTKKRRRSSDTTVIVIAAASAGGLVAASGLGPVMTAATIVFFAGGLAVARFWIRGD